MAPYNNGKPWTDKEIKDIKKLARKHTPSRVIALVMGRSRRAIYSKAAQIQLSFR